MGSYLLTFHKKGFDSVSYPVFIERSGHWANINPEGEEEKLHLPPKGFLNADEAYIPAGWFVFGGDPKALNGLPKTKMWLDGFKISSVNPNES